MKLSEIYRILRHHFFLILVAPILLALIVIILTRNPAFKFSSETTLYTGFTSTSTVDMSKSSNYFTVNTAFDNLISVITSRETQQEVSIRLLAQHLMLARNNPRFFTEKSYDEIHRITPAYVKKLVVKSNIQLNNSDRNNFSSLNSQITPGVSIPASIDPFEFEQTVANLKTLMLSSDTNYVYKLLNYDHPHYSIEAISNIVVKRVENSDLLKIKYESDDPGISQQTLNIYSDVCIKNYKRIAENRSDAVIKYFDKQLEEAAKNLKVAEDKLLEFNNSNKIINYNEQSKAVAIAKENLTDEYNNKRTKLAGVEAVIRRLEEKLGSQKQVQLQNSNLIDQRSQLGELNYQISSAEVIGSSDPANALRLADLRRQADKLKNEIRASASLISTSGTTTDGLPIATILKDWIDNVVESENLKASIGVLEERMKEQQKEYSVYAPAGSNIKRIEREITVSEQRYLDILHSLNLAKLKMQDNELSSNIKIFDEPFFPLTPVPTKRKIMVALAAMMGLFIVLAYIFLIEFLDNTLKNPSKASAIIKQPVISVIPKILLKHGKVNLTVIFDRLLDITVEYIELFLNEKKSVNHTKTLLFFSTLRTEGKSVLVTNLAQKLGDHGKKVLVISYDHELIDHHNQPPTEDAGNTGDNSVAKRTAKWKRSSKHENLGYHGKHIDHKNPLLIEPADEFKKFELVRFVANGSFYSVTNYKDIVKLCGHTLSFTPDFVLIELPSIMYNSYPVTLLSNSDLAILVCRSNRAWTQSDQAAFDRFTRFTDKKAVVILNGVELSVVDSVLGDFSEDIS
ncbi:MAG: hypothetical protein WCP08_02395 [Prolixibacteraceae bacterium]